MLIDRRGRVSMNRVRTFFNKYKHGCWMLAYMAFYMVGFFILENAGHRHYHVIHTVFDDMIPFCEYFIIPYLLWFGYVAVAMAFFFFFSLRPHVRRRSTATKGGCDGGQGWPTSAASSPFFSSLF